MLLGRSMHRMRVIGDRLGDYVTHCLSPEVIGLVNTVHLAHRSPGPCGEKLGDYSHLGYGAQKHLLKVIFFLITILHHSITFFCSFIFIWMHLCRYCFIYIFPFFLTPLAWIFFKYI